MAKLLKKGPELKVFDGRQADDTVRVWERYKASAHMWRFLALIQIPLACVAMFTMLTMYFSGDTIVQVPERPQPGQYSVKRLPDSEFVNVAIELANLTTTYTPVTAEKQFKAARKLLWEPALSQFEKDKVEVELRQIQESSRTQIFLVDQKQIKVERQPDLDFVVVRLAGIKTTIVGSRPLPEAGMNVYVRMTTVPKNPYNEFGIVVTDLRYMDVSIDTFAPAVAPEQGAVAATPGSGVGNKPN